MSFLFDRLFYAVGMALTAIDYRSEDAARLFTASLRQTGFGVLKNHPISQNAVENIYKTWHSFFQSESKHLFHYNVQTQDGYFPPSVSEIAKGFTKKDIKEYFHFYPNGQCPEHLRDQIQDYYDAATDLASELLSWIEKYSPEKVALNYSQSLSSMIADSDQSCLRILHYPPLQGNEEAGAIRAAPHEDINLITILPAANEPGLQVKDHNGQWVDVPCDFGNLIVNIGDMLQECSGHYYPSTTHRVVNPVGQNRHKGRISLPLFLHPKPEVVLSDRYSARGYLRERLQELGVL